MKKQLPSWQFKIGQNHFKVENLTQSNGSVPFSSKNKHVHKQESFEAFTNDLAIYLSWLEQLSTTKQAA